MGYSDVHAEQVTWCLNSILALASANRIKLSMCRAVIGAPPEALTGRLAQLTEGSNFHQ